MSGSNKLLAGKVALITGSARGTGAGIARTFAREGAAIVLNQVVDEGDPDAVLAELRDAGANAIAINADITDEAAVAAMVGEASAALGPIDILVNNYAAPVPSARFSESTWQTWKEQIDYTVKAAFVCCQALGSGAFEWKGGTIVNVTSRLPTRSGATMCSAPVRGMRTTKLRSRLK